MKKIRDPEQRKAGIAATTQSTDNNNFLQIWAKKQSNKTGLSRSNDY